MAGKIFRPSLLSSKCSYSVLSRFFSSSNVLSEKEGWLDKLFVRKIEPTKESHSSLLSDKEIIYELQTHNVRPGHLGEYLKNYENYVKAVDDKNLPVKLAGSWTVGIGDQDQCLHLWRYEGGYTSVDNVRTEFQTDSSVQALLRDRNAFLRQRTSQILLAFSFWPPVTPRSGNNIYEIRSYFLKPGTMIEWGNNWARAIKFRQQNNEAYGGFFSQVGRLYNVHHIWCFDSMADRKSSRENVWQNPGWDQIVAYTVPLIKEMHTRIVYPNDFSDTK